MPNNKFAKVLTLFGDALVDQVTVYSKQSLKYALLEIQTYGHWVLTLTSTLL